MGDGNSFPLVVRLSPVILACKSMVLCKCSGNVLLDMNYSTAYSTMIYQAL